MADCTADSPCEPYFKCIQLEKSFDKLQIEVKTNEENMWRKINTSSDSQIETKVIMTGLKTDVANLSKQIASLVETQGGKWETFWQKIAVGFVGAAVTIVVYMITQVVSKVH